MRICVWKLKCVNFAIKNVCAGVQTTVTYTNLRNIWTCHVTISRFLLNLFNICDICTKFNEFRIHFSSTALNVSDCCEKLKVHSLYEYDIQLRRKNSLWHFPSEYIRIALEKSVWAELWWSIGDLDNWKIDQKNSTKNQQGCTDGSDYGMFWMGLLMNYHSIPLNIFFILLLLGITQWNFEYLIM